MNVIDIKTRRPLGQPTKPLVEFEILDGFPANEKPDDIVLVEIFAPASAVRAILLEIDIENDAFLAAWASRVNVIDIWTGKALPVPSAPRPVITETDEGVTLESFLLRDQATGLAQLVAEMNRAAFSIAS